MGSCLDPRQHAGGRAAPAGLAGRRRREHALLDQTPPAEHSQVLQAHLQLPRCILGPCETLDYAAAAAALQRYTGRQELR